MKEELITLIQNANDAINSLENYLFTNHREFYIYGKNKIDACKDAIKYVSNHLNEFDDEELSAALEDVKGIITTINEAKLGYDNLANQIATTTSTEGVEEQTANFTEEELNTLLDALDTNSIDSLLPQTEEALTDLTVDNKIPDPETFEQKDFPEMNIPNLDESFGTTEVTETITPLEATTDPQGFEVTTEPIMTTAFANDTDDAFRI